MSSIKRIIIIDDDLISTIIADHVIKQLLPGIEVFSFSLPEEGLEFIKTAYLVNPVKTLLLLDINMPLMSGWEVLERLASYNEIIREHILIYICSSSISFQDKILSSQHRLVIDFVEKPITKYKLIDIIRRERYNRKQYFTTYNDSEDSIYL